MMSSRLRSYLGPIGAAACLIAGCPGTVQGPLTTPTPALSPGVYIGDVSLETTTVFTPADGSDAAEEEPRSDSFTFTIGIGLGGLPLSPNGDGPIETGNQLVTSVGVSRLAATATDVVSDADGVVITYDISGPLEDAQGQPVLPPLPSIGTGTDTYTARAAGELLFSREWLITTTTSAGTTETTIQGEGVLEKQ